MRNLILGSIFAILTSLITFAGTWLFNNIVTKQQSETQYLELRIQINDMQLTAYDAMDSMNASQKRSYDALVANTRKIQDRRNELLGLWNIFYLY